MQNRYSEVPCIKRGIDDFIASARILVAGLWDRMDFPKEAFSCLIREIMLSFLISFCIHCIGSKFCNK